jgi:hypothetical protein
MPMPLSVMVSVLAPCRRHAHFEVGRVFVQRGVVQRLEAQLVAGVRGVGDQLAQEDFLVGVQRMRDQVQQLGHFGLEGKGLFAHRGLKDKSKAKEGAPHARRRRQANYGRTRQGVDSHACHGALVADACTPCSQCTISLRHARIVEQIQVPRAKVRYWCGLAKARQRAGSSQAQGTAQGHQAVAHQAFCQGLRRAASVAATV